jgi:hypothetical protein
MRRFAVVAQGHGIGQEAVSDLSIGCPGFTLHEPTKISTSHIAKLANRYTYSIRASPPLAAYIGYREC